MTLMWKSLIVISIFFTIVSCVDLTDGNFDHGEAFDHPHEEGDEHVVNQEVCSKQDLPDSVLDAYDRCTNFIPAYKKLNLLTRCRAQVFPHTSSKNEIRKTICFNETAEHEFNQCLSGIKRSAEGKAVPPPNPLQTMDFMFCMKTIAVRRVRQMTGNRMPCQTVLSPDGKQDFSSKN